MTPIQVILALAALYNLVLVFIILRKTHAYQSGRSFAWFILCTAIWMACAALMHDTFPSGMILFLIRTTFVVATFMAISGLWFCADFPYRSTRFRRLAGIFTLLGLPWFFIAWTPLLITGVTALPWADHATISPLVSVFFAWIITCIIASVIHLVWKERKIRGLERLQLRYILLGIIGLTIGTIPNLVVPIITHSTRFAHFGPLASLFVTSTTTYAIVRYRLMDIKIVVRAGLIYSLTLGTLSLLFTLLVPLFDTVLKDFFHLPSRLGSFLTALLIAMAFQPVFRYTQHQVDRRFFKSVYDYKVTLREAGNALASVRDRESLMATLEDALVRTLRSRWVAIYLPGHDDVLTLMMPISISQELPFTLPQTEPLLTHAVETDDVMLMEEMIRCLEPAYSIGQRLKAWSVHVAVPLIAGGRLSGMVFLGEKLSGDVYTADDAELLRILGKQAAIALENARHYHEMVLMNDYHARLLHIMQDGVIALDPQQRVITFNSAAKKITGVSASEAMGQRLADIRITDLPVAVTGEQGIEAMLTTRSGEQIPVLVTVTPFTRRWENADSHLIVFRDLSMLRFLEQQKMQAERFSSMGAMAASLAHEIKNPLVPIRFFAHMLPSKYDDAEFRKEFSVTVVNEVERINRLVGQMLDLVRKPSSEREVIDLCEVIEQLLALTRADCERQQIVVHTDFADTTNRVVGVRAQLYQAILNVMTNALQVMPDGGELHISTEALEGKLICRISDSGPGVPSGVLQHIFEPLYTTKPEGHGLGLALAYHFVQSHGGEVSADCLPGRGLRICLLLPAYSQKEANLLCSL